MGLSPEELRRRLERADHQRKLLSRATRELRDLGQRVLRDRSDGPRRPDRGRTRETLAATVPSHPTRERWQRVLALAVER
jgi:hypothetical protein